MNVPLVDALGFWGYSDTLNLRISMSFSAAYPLDLDGQHNQWSPQLIHLILLVSTNNGQFISLMDSYGKVSNTCQKCQLGFYSWPLMWQSHSCQTWLPMLGMTLCKMKPF